MNLIPQHYRDEFRYERMTKFATYVGTVILIVAISWGVLLLPSYFFLSTQLSVTQLASATASEARAKEISRLTKEIGEVNTVLSTVKSLKTTDASIVELLREIMERTGNGITYQNINIAKGAGNTITAQGFAVSRQDLQLLKASMESSAMIAEVDIPVDTFSEIENIAFTMTLTLK